LDQQWLGPVPVLQRAKFAEFDADKSGFLEAKEIDEVITWTLQAFPSDSNVDTYRER
jgi:hypothetical protein